MERDVTGAAARRSKLPNEAKQKEAAKIRREKTIGVGWSILMLCVTYALIAAEYTVFLIKAGQAWQSVVGSLVLIAMGFGAFGVYAYIRREKNLATFSRMLLLCVLLVIACAPLPVTMRVDVGFTVHVLAAMLIAVLTNRRLAMLSSVPVAAAAGVTAFVVSGVRGAPMGMILAAAVTAIAAVLALGISSTRSNTVIAAGLAGAAGAITYGAAMLACGEAFEAYWRTLLWILGGSVLCGILAVGFMPVFETLFDIPTDARLNELLNNNNPLLKRLMTEASGTYHHSLTVAALAEAAAEQVGANALLCRVAATYHDVGKLKDPLCFKENQRTENNVHNDLDPYESARRIIAHQQDSVELLEKHKFPGAVVRIAGEHHGDSVMVYFYDRAKKAAPEGTEVDVSKFRYPSGKPSTKESAIIMLADCCEAAVRSMKEPTMRDIAAKVREIINHKWDKRGSMLWDSPLSFAEINKIETSFLRTFAALYHERVEYPDLEEIDVR